MVTEIGKNARAVVQRGRRRQRRTKGCRRAGVRQFANGRLSRPRRLILVVGRLIGGMLGMVSGKVAHLLDAIRQWNRIDGSPEAVSFFDEVIAVYQSANQDDRSQMRCAVAENRAVWNLLGDDALSHYLNRVRHDRDALSSLRSSLLVCSITGGIADWRDTIVWLESLWDDGRERGVDPWPHFLEIASISETRNCHGISGMSTNGLFINAVCNRVYEERQRAERRRHQDRGTVDELIPRRRTRRWWKFWA